MSGKGELSKKERKALKKEKEKMEEEMREQAAKELEAKEKEAKFDQDLRDNTDPVTKMDIHSILDGKGTLSSANLKKILSVITRRDIVQKAMMLITAVLFVIMLGGAFGLLVYLFETPSATYGIVPIVVTFMAPQLFTFTFVVCAGAAVASKEIDVILGLGLTFVISYVLYIILGSIVLSDSTSIFYSSCPSMDRPGTALHTFAYLFSVSNFTFYPLNFLNPDNVPGYFLNSDYQKLFYYTTTEIMCYTGHFIGFYWWLNFAMILIGAFLAGGLLLDFYRRRELLNNLMGVIYSKYNYHEKDGKPYINISALRTHDV